ncbi:LOW QUALITY PROTEIN: RWD domain-containing protein 2A [Galleria mellonella]|uniref:LOW QUALITY PROTEIN: RWD domain-containing protein 2A n=1 Tax=Galleria mellonella TaxID=7137 RepID=A0A6J1WEJ3_GALME|nr:LOW QUALITY PROTEIN: RWD domain-containing protein 2A [Galleria mellonella]
MSLNLNSTQNSIRELYIISLKQQLSEYELLKSMYPNNDDIKLTDNNILKDINSFLENKLEYAPPHLDFTLNLLLNNLKLEMCINLPSLYPEEEPDIYIRCNQLNRHQETNLNFKLMDYIKNNHSGEVCLYTAITWLQENIETFCDKKETETDDSSIQELKSVQQKFIRQWIYSHHIYNKKKREEIIKKARELKLTGFCVPGKPGIICIEGSAADCKEWWKDIKSMSWKKIMVRKTETFELNEQGKEQKFNSFDEIHFKNPSSRFNKHADLSGLSKYMEQCGLSQAFHDVFGLNGDI